MTTITNICPNCKATKIDELRYGKFTCGALSLIIIGIPLIFAAGIGFVFILAGLIMGSISGYKYSCPSCGAQWH